jgi:hypothetical protein
MQLETKQQTEEIASRLFSSFYVVYFYQHE